MLQESPSWYMERPCREKNAWTISSSSRHPRLGNRYEDGEEATLDVPPSQAFGWPAPADILLQPPEGTPSENYSAETSQSSEPLEIVINVLSHRFRDVFHTAAENWHTAWTCIFEGALHSTGEGEFHLLTFGQGLTKSEEWRGDLLDYL